MTVPITFADSHCHLDFRDFDGDREAVLGRAHEAGVGFILNPGTDLESSRKAVELAGRHEAVYAAVGVHPNDAEAFDEAMVDGLRRLAAEAKVVAIGEVGMDFHWNRLTAVEQRSVLEAQLDLAAELDLPVIIHSREASRAILDVLEREAPRLPGVVLHAFSGDRTEARRALDLDAYLGIAGPVTFKKADDLREVVAWAPLDRLLIETDSPYLTPHPWRGRRNEPAFVRHVAERVAEIKAVPLETVAGATWANARRVFAVGEVS